MKQILIVILVTFAITAFMFGTDWETKSFSGSINVLEQYGVCEVNGDTIHYIDTNRDMCVKEYKAITRLSHRYTIKLN